MNDEILKEDVTFGCKFEIRKMGWECAFREIDIEELMNKEMGCVNYKYLKKLAKKNCIFLKEFLKPNLSKTIKDLVDLISENPELPIFAWVDGQICEDNYGCWLGQFGSASIREYAKVKAYNWYENNYVFKDDYEDYLNCLLNENKNLTEKEAIDQILNLDYKKAIFVYVNTPNNF